MKNLLLASLFTLVLTTNQAASAVGPWSLGVDLGHQSCSAEGGAVCSDETSGFVTGLTLGYAIYNWLEAGISGDYGVFGGEDGYTTATALARVQATYYYEDWGFGLEGGLGFMRAYFEREEPSAGVVEYTYSTFQALRLGGVLRYKLSDALSIDVKANFSLGGKSELCITSKDVNNACRDNQDLIDLTNTTLGARYTF